MNYRVRGAADEARVSIDGFHAGPGGWSHFEWSVDGGEPAPARARLERDEVVIETGGARHRVHVGPGTGAGVSEVALGPESFAFHVLRGAGSDKLGTAGASSGPQPVTAPMPGRVQKVHVEVGQDVKRGQLLVTLEAMKMQNEFLAPADGRILEVRVSAGSVAGAGDVLVVLEPGPHA